MKQRRGSSLWGETDGMASWIYRFEPGDLVIPVAVMQSDFLGVVKEVMPKLNKVMVLWGGGSLKQHDPDEIMLHPHQDPIVKSRMASSRRSKTDSVKTAGGMWETKTFKNRQEMEKWVKQNEHKYECEEILINQPTLKDPSHAVQYRKLRQASIKTRRSAADNPVPHGDMYVGDPEMHGINEARGGGFSIMQDLQKDLHKEMKQESDVEVNPRIGSRRGKASFFVDEGEKASDSSLKSRRAMEFPTQDAMDKYLKEHPEADKSNHKVVETKKDAPVKLRKEDLEVKTNQYIPRGGHSGQGLAKNYYYIQHKDLGVYHHKDKKFRKKPLTEMTTHWYENKDEAEKDLNGLVEEPKAASVGDLRSRRAMYWGAPDRVYRLTREEQESGSALCPKCHKEMGLEPFTKSEKLYTCQKCGFKVPTSKTTTTRITIEVEPDGEVDVDVTTAKGKKTRRGTMFPTQNALREYMKEHPDADKSQHRVAPEGKKPWQTPEGKRERQKRD